MTSDRSSPSKKRLLLSALLPAALLLIAAWGALLFLKPASAPSTQPSFQVGATLPDFTFHQVDEGTYRLSESKARIILINFWATWCEACMEEMPSLVKLFETYRNQGVEIIGINLDEDSAQAISSTTEEFKISFRNFIDKDELLATAFDVHGIPLTVTVDSSRKILEIKSGDRDWMAPKYLEKLNGWLSH